MSFVTNIEPKIALIGNPNTGKSTIFNSLTGLKHHTGNWSGKTVGNEMGYFNVEDKKFALYDLPGIYSLFSHSAEEYHAMEFIVKESPDITIVVADANTLERNLLLPLQIMEMTQNVILCLNLMDEAKQNNIKINTEKLEAELGIPIIKMVARDGMGLDKLKRVVYDMSKGYIVNKPILTEISSLLPTTFSYLETNLKGSVAKEMNNSFYYSFLLDKESNFLELLSNNIKSNEDFENHINKSIQLMGEENANIDTLKELRSLVFLKRCKQLSEIAVRKDNEFTHTLTKKLDNIFLSKIVGVPIMLFMISMIFFITISGANIPSNMLMNAFENFGFILNDLFISMNVHPLVHGFVLDGVYLTASWVISVMLPPMAIFFPLFTLLEDFGLLPRIAFHLDGLFQRSNAHGKQALTMCMGFGCNAAGITSCRIIESKRERLIAIITNNFVPCNGRFPTLILLSTLFLSAGNSIVATLWILGLISTSVAITLFISKLLSKTLLKGEPSSFIMELPPYRKPKIGQVLIRSLLDRTILVLARAVAVAIPAGAVIWLLQNTIIADKSVLFYIAEFLDPFGQMLGLSGVILMAFILGMPANEIVIPILMMMYAGTGMMIEPDMFESSELFIANGWTFTTALCAIVFSLNHFPCATALITIYNETKSKYWTFVSAILPTLVGIFLCITINFICGFFI